MSLIPAGFLKALCHVPRFGVRLTLCCDQMNPNITKFKIKLCSLLRSCLILLCSVCCFKIFDSDHLQYSSH